MFSVVEFAKPGEAPCRNPTVGVVQTPVGPAMLAWDAIGVRSLDFGSGDAIQSYRAPYGCEGFSRDDKKAGRLASEVFEKGVASIPLVLCGTDFQRQVWRALMALEFGQRISYGELARNLGNPRAARAVGSAVGANVLGFLVPCHRVVRQDGAVGDFRWGADVKRRLLAWEATRVNESQ